ncbi:NAD(P)H-dependent oxidoreductase [Propionibacteriaceae bacterium G1746]
MTTLIIDGHPNPYSLCAALARSYHAGNPDATLLAVRDLDFAADLAHGMTRTQRDEPDVLRARELIEAAARIVVVTPTWWSSIPPMLKGFFDRVFTPGWAYRYNKLPLGLPGGAPEGLLSGRRGRVLITSDTPAWLLRPTGDHAARMLKNHVLGFCGIAPVRVTRFGGVRWTTPEQRQAWLDRAMELGQADAARQLPAPAPKPQAMPSADVEQVSALEAQHAGV